MKRKTPPRSIRSDGQLYQRLVFPKRAELLGQFDSYQVQLSHWGPLATPIKDAFEGVYTRGDAAILLIHGAQSSGKTLFCQRLLGDFDRACKGACKPDEDNLWHKLVGGQPAAENIIKTATQHTYVHRIKPEPGWRSALIQAAPGTQDRKVRIYIIDDAHRDSILCEWASVSQEWYLDQAESKKPAILGTMAQRMVEDCRGVFQRSIFLLVSNQRPMMEQLKVELDRWENGLATLLELPLPTPTNKEKIIDQHQSPRW